jgi:hypothetical protein
MTYHSMCDTSYQVPFRTIADTSASPVQLCPSTAPRGNSQFLTRHAHRGQAQYVIDKIDMLRQNAKGNLTPSEQNMIESVLRQLRTLFVESSVPRRRMSGYFCGIYVTH